MKLFRNILFFTTVFIMIGHDIVPHTDLTEDDHISISTASTTGFQQIDHEHIELSHIFEHFQHSAYERTLNYVAGNVQNFNVKTKIFQTCALTVNIDNQFIWHANFEKQRFRDYSIIPYFTTLSSHTLRGPPSC